FRGILFTSVHSDTDASVLRAEIAVLLAKDAIEPVPPAEMKLGFYSPYFIVPKKNGGLRPILDLCVLNRSLHKMPFKMLTPKRIISCIRHQDWFAAIDLKDAYFHVSILPRHRRFLRFAFEGRVYQYKVLPFGLALSPRVFTKLAEGALAPSSTIILLPDRGSPRHGRPGTQLAPGTNQVRLSPSEPPCTDPVQDPGERGAGPASCAVLAHPDLVRGTHAPRDSPSLEDSPEKGPSFSGDGHHLAAAPHSMEPSRMASGRDAADLSGFPQAVIDTITQARAPSTRQAYALRWGQFVDWCFSRQEDPQRCSVGVVLSFLQEKLEQRLSPSTLKIYVAAIAAYHDAVDGLPLGRHHLIVRFLRGARRLNPPCSHLIPSWDLCMVLTGLRRDPIEPLESVELKYLSLKTSLLVALTSIKRVGDLHAFSVNESCLEFGPAESHIRLRPRPGYVPKVPTTPFRDQVVSLEALPPEEADSALVLLCPVWALHIYVERSQSFRRSEQLFVCFGGQQKGNVSPNRGWPIGWLMPSPWSTSARFEPTPPPPGP
ncbi:hypothetical protein M9458_027825, partial [Cirrhinus mrigala]